MIFPASAFLDSSSLEESRHQLHQQAASYYKDDYAIVTPCVGGGHQGNNNNLHNQQGSAMAAAGPEGGGGGGGQCLMARPEAGVACPRCDSTNTKFCYFNNYSLSQPRHFCRACRRYWTRGGALRNVPVGRRHAKRKPTTTKQPSPAPAAASACTMTTMLSSSNASPILPPPPATAALSRCSFPAPAGMAAVQSRLHSFPFLHALPLDHHIMGPPGPPTGIQTMFHLGLQSAGVMSSQQDGREFPAVKTDEDQHE
ncbi:hypothetical protein ACP4OV_019345 [Aristida adscensionis]